MSRPDPDAIRGKFAAARADLAAARVERDPEVDLVLTALLARHRRPRPPARRRWAWMRGPASGP